MAPNRRTRSGQIEAAVGLLALAGIVAVGAALALRRDAPIRPELVVEPANLDFGTAWEQPRLRHTFAVRNPTDRAVRVGEIGATCGCTKIEPQGFSVPAGGRQDVTVTLDLSGRAGNGEVSAFRVELLPIIAHEPPGRRTVWPLEGEVRRNPIEISEPLIDFGETVILGEAVVARAVDVALASGSHCDDLRAEVDSDAGTARIESAGPGKWRLEVAPSGRLVPGPFDFAVRVQATGDGAGPFPARELRVTGTVRHDIAAWPAEVKLGAMKAGESHGEYLVLASQAGRPFEVTRIVAPPGVTIEPAPDQLDGGSRTFVLTLTASGRGHQRSRVEFHVRRLDLPSGEPADRSVPLELSHYVTTARP